MGKGERPSMTAVRLGAEGAWKGGSNSCPVDAASGSCLEYGDPGEAETLPKCQFFIVTYCDSPRSSSS